MNANKIAIETKKFIDAYEKMKAARDAAEEAMIREDECIDEMVRLVIGNEQFEEFVALRNRFDQLFELACEGKADLDEEIELKKRLDKFIFEFTLPDGYYSLYPNGMHIKTVIVRWNATSLCWGYSQIYEKTDLDPSPSAIVSADEPVILSFLEFVCDKKNQSKVLTTFRRVA